MNFFWPTKPSTSPGLIGRLGRFAHWVGLAVAVTVAATGLALGREESSAYWLLAVALIPAQLGRAVRYVLAGE